MHYFQFNIKSYRAATAHLTDSEDLAYRRLIEHYYDTEQQIPTALPPLCRRLRLALPDVEIILNEFFELTESGWSHPFIDADIAKYQEYIERQRTNGSKGGRGIKAAGKPDKPTALPDKPTAKPTNNQQPLTINHEPLTMNHEPLNSKPVAPPKKSLAENLPDTRRENPAAPKSETETELQTACRQVWASYGKSYFDRYGTEPVRNAKVNALVKQLVQRLGGEDAPHVAAHFVGSNTAYYVQRGHSFECLLSDAEKLRTEWATGSSMTATRARQLDQSQANYSAVGEAMKILERNGYETATLPPSRHSGMHWASYLTRCAGDDGRRLATIPASGGAASVG